MQWSGLRGELWYQDAGAGAAGTRRAILDVDANSLRPVQVYQKLDVDGRENEVAPTCERKLLLLHIVVDPRL